MGIYRQDLSSEAEALALVLDDVELTEEREDYGEGGMTSYQAQSLGEWVADEILEKLAQKGWKLVKVGQL